MTTIEPQQRKRVEGASTSSLEVVPPLPFFADLDLMSIAVEAGKIGIWSWDIAANQATWSTNIEEICGLAKGTFNGSAAALENDVHPDDRAAVTAAMREALVTRTPRRVQYRLLPRPGVDERWIETIATVVVERG